MESRRNDRNDSHRGPDPVAACADCPFRLINPEDLPPELVAILREIQLTCRGRRQKAIALGGRFKCEPTLLQVGDLRLDPFTYTATRAGRLIELTRSETRLLAYLMRHEGEICRRKDLLEQVWHYERDADTNTLTEHIKLLRRKTRTGSETPLIQTVRGKGYLIKA